MIYQLVKGLSKLTTSSKKVLPDIIMLDFTIVKAYLVGSNQEGWVLVDTGLENSSDKILQTVDEYIGKNSRPEAIILTHGHFDHIGSVIKLSEHWDVPVYAHEQELPYLNGEKDYPKGDPSADEGLVAKMSPAFPNEGINMGSRLKKLSVEGYVPGMKGWEWIHTPGHTEGHVSLFRSSDGTMIVGDAFTTTKQESLLSVLSQKEDIKGPPAYLTKDWENAKRSVGKLMDLDPKLALPSHGDLMQGEELRKHLDLLYQDFENQTVPDEKNEM